MKKKEEIQTFISVTFHKHLCWLIYIDTSKYTNKHKQTQTQETLNNKHT